MASATRPTSPPISCLPEYLLASSCSILSLGLGPPRAPGPAGAKAAICRVDGALAGNDTFGLAGSAVEPGWVAAAGLGAAFAGPVAGTPAIAAATLALTSE